MEMHKRGLEIDGAYKGIPLIHSSQRFNTFNQSLLLSIVIIITVNQLAQRDQAVWESLNEKAIKETHCLDFNQKNLFLVNRKQ